MCGRQYNFPGLWKVCEARKVSCFCESLCKTIFEKTTGKLYSLRETEWSQQMGVSRCTRTFMPSVANSNSSRVRQRK